VLPRQKWRRNKDNIAFIHRILVHNNVLDNVQIAYLWYRSSVSFSNPKQYLPTSESIVIHIKLSSIIGNRLQIGDLWDRPTTQIYQVSPPVNFLNSEAMVCALLVNFSWRQSGKVQVKLTFNLSFSLLGALVFEVLQDTL